MRFTPPKDEYTLRDLADFVIEYRPKTIEMTLQQEFWYRNLLTPDFAVPASIEFHGIPVVIID